MKNRLGHLIDLLMWCKRKWGEIHPTQAWLARTLKWKLRTLQRWIQVAKRLGLLRVRSRYRKSAIYELLSPQRFGGVSGGAELKPEPQTQNQLPPRKPFSKAQWPPDVIVNEYGRRILNPAFIRVREAIRRAQDRIRRARNPEAYANAIILRESLV